MPIDDGFVRARCLGHGRYFLMASTAMDVGIAIPIILIMFFLVDIIVCLLLGPVLFANEPFLLLSEPCCLSLQPLRRARLDGSSTPLAAKQIPLCKRKCVRHLPKSSLRSHDTVSRLALWQGPEIWKVQRITCPMATSIDASHPHLPARPRELVATELQTQPNTPVTVAQRPHSLLSSGLGMIFRIDFPGGSASMCPSRRFLANSRLRPGALPVLASAPAYARRSGENETARTERSQGTVALNLGNYDEAVEHFSRAYSLTQDAALLFSLAQAYRLGGKADKALATYSAFLRAAVSSPKYRGQIERAAAEIESITSFMLNRPVDTPTLRPRSQGPSSRRPRPPLLLPRRIASQRRSSREEHDEVSPPDLVAAKLEPPALLPKPEPATPPAVDFAVQKKASREPASRPVYKRWWFLTSTAVVLVAAGAAAWWYTRPINQTPGSTYGAVKVLP